MKRRIIPRIISRFGIEIRMNAQFRYVAGASTQDTSLHPPFHPRLGLARTCWPLRAPLSVCDSAPPPQSTTRRSLSPVPLLSYLCRDGPTGAVAEEEERECATLVPSQAIVSVSYTHLRAHETRHDL